MIVDFLKNVAVNFTSLKRMQELITEWDVCIYHTPRNNAHLKFIKNFTLIFF